MQLKHLLVLLPLLLVCSCKPDRPTSVQETDDCQFPVPEPVSRSTSEGSYDDQSTLEGEAGVGVDISPYFKKLADLDINISGGGGRVTRAYERIVREYEADNPTFTQIAWLHWSVAYGLYERVCKDSTISAEEAELKKDEIINHYKSELPRIQQTTKPEKKDNRRQATGENKPPSNPIPAQPKPNYLTGNTPMQVAVLTTGDKSHYNFGDTFGNWLRQQHGFSVNTGLFTPAFYGAYGVKIRARDISAFKEVGATGVTNCVCWLDQDSKLEESALAGESFVTAILSGQLTLFNLKQGTQTSISLSERGAGITINRAMESLEEKLYVNFANLTQALNACR